VRAAPLVLAFLVPTLVLASGCRRDELVETAPPPVGAVPSAVPVAADQLRPGELAEGTEQMFGLLAPRGLRVVRRFADSVSAVGEPSAERVANYVRDRVDPERVDFGPTRTVFSNATVRGDTSGKVLRIEVIQHPSRTELVVRDVTPVPIEPDLTEAERWRKAGLSPSGEQLDLQTLH